MLTKVSQSKDAPCEDAKIDSYSLNDLRFQTKSGADNVTSIPSESGLSATITQSAQLANDTTIITDNIFSEANKEDPISNLTQIIDENEGISEELDNVDTVFGWNICDEFSISNYLENLNDEEIGDIEDVLFNNQILDELDEIEEHSSNTELRKRSGSPQTNELITVLPDIDYYGCHSKQATDDTSMKKKYHHDKETNNVSTDAVTPIYNETRNKKSISISDSRSKRKNISLSSSKRKNKSLSNSNRKNISLSSSKRKTKSLSSSKNKNKSLKKSFICDFCKKPFNDKIYLIRHISNHPELLECTHCSYKTYQNRHLREHVNAKHTQQTSYDCTYCDYKTFHKRQLRRHINAKHTKTTLFECSYCDFKTYTKNYLNQHVNAKHTKNKSFPCSYCDFTAYDKSNLTKHINTKHTKSTVFNCTYCDYETFVQGHLNEHIRTKHTKSTYFNCSYCSYTALRKSNLGEHINAKHTNYVSFDCPYCSYKSFDKSSVTKHVNATHTKSKIFNCFACNYKTCYRANYNKHMKSKH